MANQLGQASGCQQRQHKTHSTQHESAHGYSECDWAGEAEQPQLCCHVVQRSEIHRVWRVRVTKHLMMSSSHPVVLTAFEQQFGTCGVFRVSGALRKGRAPKDTNPRRLQRSLSTAALSAPVPKSHVSLAQSCALHPLCSLQLTRRIVRSSTSAHHKWLPDTQ